MSSLGIYFGPKIIGLVETQGRKVVKSIQIPQPVPSADAEGKASDEARLIQLVALFKDEFRKNKIESAEATLCLSGRELIIRAFEMPLLPRSELKNAINYEVKKYIPFKVEDMISDFQVQVNRGGRVNLVLFVGIKKDMLDKYVALMHQLDLKLNAIEYSAFSMLRCLKVAGLRDSGAIALINADLQGSDEANFTVLKNGFPLFSRDFLLSAAQDELVLAKGPAAPGMALEKLNTEIRVSLDYYMRKFSESAIQQMYFVSNPENQPEIETFIKETGIPVRFVDTAKFFGKTIPFNLDVVKAYGASLTKTVKGRINIDILAKRPQPERVTPSEGDIQQQLAAFWYGINLDFRVLALAVLICAGTFAQGFWRIATYQKELAAAEQARPQLAFLSPTISDEELQGFDTDYKKKIKIVGDLINKQFYVSRVLGAVPHLMPDGLWLTELSFFKTDTGADLELKGKAYTGDNDKDMLLVNAFIAGLKADPVFGKLFKDINIESVTQSNVGETPVVDFSVNCRNQG